MSTFSVAFLSDHKARVPAPVVKSPHSCFTLSLWGDSSGPHRFSHTNSLGLSKTEPCLLPQSFKVHEHSIPNCLGHTRACPPFSQSSTEKNKTNGRRRSDYLFLQSPHDSTMTKKDTPAVTLLPCNSASAMSESSHILHKGVFLEVIPGQHTGSVPRMIYRKRTLWCRPVKLSVPYVSLGPWDSLTKFNCSKRPHQQALSTPIRPRPIVSGQGVRCFCPTAQNPDSSQTGPSCRFIQQIMPVKGCSGPKAVTVWIAVACLHCQGFSVTRL